MSATSSRQQTTFRVSGMDCGACARTVEKVVAGLEGVDAARVSFGNASLVVDGAAPVAAVEAAVRRAGYAARPVGADAQASPSWRRDARTVSTAASVAVLAAAVVASLAAAPRAIAEPLYLLSMAAGGWPIVIAAAAALRRRTLEMNVLMALAATGAVAIGEYAEGAWVLVLFAIGTTLETFALDRSRRSVEALMELAPPEATIVTDGGLSAVPVDEVDTGARVLVRPGERVPLDGRVVDGRSSIDESPLTGESIPVDKEPGDSVFAGTMNAFGALTVETTSPAAESALARIAQLVADAQGSQAPAERFVDRFARIYTPVVFVAALAVAVVPLLFGGDPETWAYRALALLIVACPCALVISVPVSVVSAIGGAARRGVLIKGGQALEALGRIRIVALDKTGTLTEGVPQLVGVHALAAADEDDALAMIAALERASEHPLAAALVRAAQERRLQIREAVGFEARPGLGVVGRVGGRRLWAGGPRMAAEEGAEIPSSVEALGAKGQTVVLLGDREHLIAAFGLADRPRANARDAVVELLGDAQVVMLTGDSEPVARSVAEAVGVSDWRAGLLPPDKLAAVRELREIAPTAMVGDGINDAPALAGADIGVAMGAMGSDVALESADVALMGDDLRRLPEAIAHGRRALSVMRQNVAVSLLTKVVFVVLAPLGYVTLVVAVAADMGVSLLVTLNALRLLRVRGEQEPPSSALRPTTPLSLPIAAPPAAACCDDDGCRRSA